MLNLQELAVACGGLWMAKIPVFFKFFAACEVYGNEGPFLFPGGM
jgi:hypothetical protein